MLKKAYVINLVTFVLILFSSLWMFSGIHFGNYPTVLEGNRLAMFKFYTVDSNVFMGMVALVAAIMEKRMLDGRVDELPIWVYVIKLMGVVGVTLTMLVTVFFLMPTMGAYACFNNSNLFLHVINPIISIVCFVLFEKTKKLSFKHTFTGIVTLLIYATYYVTVSVIHSTGNAVNEGYDWYGFFAFGLKSGFIIVPLIIVITYVISLSLWRANHR